MNKVILTLLNCNFFIPQVNNNIQVLTFYGHVWSCMLYRWANGIPGDIRHTCLRFLTWTCITWQMPSTPFRPGIIILWTCLTMYGTDFFADVRVCTPPGHSSFIQHHCDQRMGQDISKSSRSDTVSMRRAMDAQQNRPRVLPKFRVLIIGRANSGKTSILQRVCDTTESPEVYRLDRQGNRERVCSCS